jgi:predicted regulator of Ras-like GTPase activity (Roadblock/LC7/MglB family)
MIMYEEEHRQISFLLNKLYREATSRACYLVDKNGQMIAEAGEITDIDSTSLSSLVAGSIAATGSLAKLIGEKEFSVLLHEGKDQHIHVSLISGGVILVVIFDDRTSLGLIRLRVKRAQAEMEEVLAKLSKKAQAPKSKTPFSEITDDDIDNLFRDDDIDKLFRE